MPEHLQRGILIITHDQRQDMSALEDELATGYTFEAWAIGEEEAREERVGIETSGLQGESIGIVMVFYAYDVTGHLAWAEALAQRHHPGQVTVRGELEEVTQAEYDAAQAAEEFKAPYWRMA